MRYQCDQNFDKLTSGRQWLGDKLLLIRWAHFLFSKTILEKSSQSSCRLTDIRDYYQDLFGSYMCIFWQLLFAKPCTQNGQQWPIDGPNYDPQKAVKWGHHPAPHADSRVCKWKAELRCVTVSLISRSYLHIIQPSADVIKIFVTTNKV